MNRTILTIVFLILVQFIVAQVENDTITSEIQSVDSCEITANNCQQLIIQSQPTEIENIWRYLNQWQQACGITEPTQRLIILLGISENVFIDSLYYDYLKYDINRYRHRVEASKEPDFKAIYQENKAYFAYDSLHSRYDEWIKALALKLKENQTEGSSSYLICTLFSENIQAFDSLIKSKEYNESSVKTSIEDIEFKSWNNSASFGVSAGMWIPMGKIQRKFNISPQFGASFMVPIATAWKLDFGGYITVFNNYKDLEMNVDNTNYTFSPDLGGTFGIWVSKEKMFEKRYSLGGIAGIAYSFINTNIEKPSSGGEDATHYNIGTIDLSIGYGIRTRIFSKKSIGLNFLYHYAPYAIDKKLVTDLGASALTLNLVFRF